MEYLELRSLAELFEESVVGDPWWGKSLSDALASLCMLRPAVMHPVHPLLAERLPGELGALAAAADAVTPALATFRDDRMLTKAAGWPDRRVGLGFVGGRRAVAGGWVAGSLAVCF